MRLPATSAMRVECQALGAKVSPADRLVALALANRADERGRPEVSYSVGSVESGRGLAFDTGLDRRTVQRCLRHLQWCGVISCRRAARGTRPALWRLSGVTDADMAPPEPGPERAAPSPPRARLAAGNDHTARHSAAPVAQGRPPAAPRTPLVAVRDPQSGGERPPLSGGERPPPGTGPPTGDPVPCPTRPAPQWARPGRSGGVSAQRKRAGPAGAALAAARVATFVAMTDDPLEARDELWRLFGHEPGLRAQAWEHWTRAHPEPLVAPPPGVPACEALREARAKLAAVTARGRRR